MCSKKYSGEVPIYSLVSTKQDACQNHKLLIDMDKQDLGIDSEMPFVKLSDNDLS